MKLFIETDEGEIIEVKELKNVNVDSNILIFFIKQVAKLKDLENVEWLLSQKNRQDLCNTRWMLFRKSVWSIGGITWPKI